MKVLIIRFSSIGDIVLTSPVIRCLKTQRPDAIVHFATKKQFATLLQFNPYIDKLHLLDGDLKAFCKELKQEQFDMIIDLHHNLRTSVIKRRIGVKRHTVDKLNWEKFLMVRFKLNMLPYLHIVDRYMETASHLGIKNDGKGLDFFLDPSASISQLNLPNQYAVYAIGGQHATKQLPLHKQLELLKTIQGPVVLIGGKEDAEQGNKLGALHPSCINLCGKLSIHQSALVMQTALVVYSHDTGMMHIAAALRKPIVSIWGNTIPEFGMTPYYPEDFDAGASVIKEVKDLYCRPCSKIGFRKCPKGHFLCMEAQEFQ